MMQVKPNRFTYVNKCNSNLKKRQMSLTRLLASAHPRLSADH